MFAFFDFSKEKNRPPSQEHLVNVAVIVDSTCAVPVEHIEVSDVWAWNCNC